MGQTNVLTKPSNTRHQGSRVKVSEGRRNARWPTTRRQRHLRRKKQVRLRRMGDGRHASREARPRTSTTAGPMAAILATCSGADLLACRMQQIQNQIFQFTGFWPQAKREVFSRVPTYLERGEDVEQEDVGVAGREGRDHAQQGA